MDIATAMIEGLSGEKIRWTEQVTIFKSETERLVGDVLVLTGFLSYGGPFNQEFRVLLQRKWFDFIQDRKIPTSVNLNIVNTLTDTATVKLYKLVRGIKGTIKIRNERISIQFANRLVTGACKVCQPMNYRFKMG